MSRSPSSGFKSAANRPESVPPDSSKATRPLLGSCVSTQDSTILRNSSSSSSTGEWPEATSFAQSNQPVVLVLAPSEMHTDAPGRVRTPSTKLDAPPQFPKARNRATPWLFIHTDGVRDQ